MNSERCGCFIEMKTSDDQMSDVRRLQGFGTHGCGGLERLEGA